MFAMLYPISFLVALTALTGWFYHKEDEPKARVFKAIFYACLVLFIMSWLLAPGPWSFKWLVLGRELLVLSLLPVLLTQLKRYGWVYFAALGVAVVLVRSVYLDPLLDTFASEEPIAGSPVDEHGELLVEIREGHRLSELQPLLDRFGIHASPAFTMAHPQATDLDDYYVLDVPKATPSLLHQVREALMANDAAEWLEANEMIRVDPPLETPARRIKERFGLDDPGVEMHWGFEVMDMGAFYRQLASFPLRKQALVAILDTGVDAGHEDLAANFVSTRPSYDVDRMGHGTHCAGIAAAVSNNGKGIASFSPDNRHVRLTSIKVLSDNGMGSQQRIINGILEAADRGADVISLSLGGRSSDRRQRAYEKAVSYAQERGSIVVVAAGNANSNARHYAPANTPGVIAVSAVDTLLNKASFSNTVEDLKWALAAPGVSVYSTVPGNQYRSMNGTSMATPYVAGLIGVLKSLRPELTTEEAYRLLHQTGKRLDAGNKTGPLIQPARALERLKQDGSDS